MTPPDNHGKICEKVLKTCYVNLMHIGNRVPIDRNENSNDRCAKPPTRIRNVEEFFLEKFNILPCSVQLSRIDLISSVPNRLMTHTDQISPSTLPQPDSTVAVFDDSSQARNGIYSKRITFQKFFKQIRNFAIDDFFGNTDAQHNILTRFHPDQYAGIGANFDQKIYASKITAYLLRTILGVCGSFVRVLNPNCPVMVDGVEITAINIPSYPGALMLLLKTDDGRVQIYGSYMHTSAELEESVTLWNNKFKIEALILNNRYVNNMHWKYDETLFRTQILKIIDSYVLGQKLVGINGIIAFNSHQRIYSMSNFIISLAQMNEMLMWVDKGSKHLFDALDIEDSNMAKILTADPTRAAIHIISDRKFERGQLLEHLARINKTETVHMLAFRTCINDDTSKASLEFPSYNNFPLCIYNIPNPFRTNYTEFMRFVRFLELMK